MSKLKVSLTVFDDHLLVEATVLGSSVDRPRVGAWSFSPTHEKLARRLMAAIEAGKALTVEGPERDCDGRSYHSASSHVLGRTMNADLRRLGF